MTCVWTSSLQKPYSLPSIVAHPVADADSATVPDDGWSVSTQKNKVFDTLGSGLGLGPGSGVGGMWPKAFALNL